MFIFTEIDPGHIKAFLTALKYSTEFFIVERSVMVFDVSIKCFSATNLNHLSNKCNLNNIKCKELIIDNRY